MNKNQIKANTFLTAEWRKLAMANYEVDPFMLKKYLPSKTELDIWQNTCYVSLVGFMFLNTKLKGIKIPFHTNFEEVNLRFYVRHKQNNEWKRGVVFIKEIVSKPALTWIANTIYKEKYETMPMDHWWKEEEQTLTVQYRWRKSKWNTFKVVAEKHLSEIKEGSEEEFITEHFWGYTRMGESKSSEYEVTHSRWKVYPIKEYSIDVDFKKIYGADFAVLQGQILKSVFLAEGSEIEVKEGRVI